MIFNGCVLVNNHLNSIKTFNIVKNQVVIDFHIWLIDLCLNRSLYDSIRRTALFTDHCHCTLS